MSEITPTRSALLELREELGAMREGYAFLDEKCLLLAGEMLRQLRRYDELSAGFERCRHTAVEALRAALARHGLEGLQCYPAIRLQDAALAVTRHGLMGLPLQVAELRVSAERPDAAANPSPEAEACRRAFAELLRLAVPLAATAGNLERLCGEYKRTIRRARALHDVLLPEVEHAVREIEARLEELELEEARWLRRRHGPAGQAPR